MVCRKGPPGTARRRCGPGIASKRRSATQRTGTRSPERATSGVSGCRGLWRSRDARSRRLAPRLRLLALGGWLKRPAVYTDEENGRAHGDQRIVVDQSRRHDREAERRDKREVGRGGHMNAMAAMFLMTVSVMVVGGSGDDGDRLSRLILRVLLVPERVAGMHDRY